MVSNKTIFHFNSTKKLFKRNYKSKNYSFQMYIEKLTSAPYKAFGIAERDTDEFIDNYARRNLITWACKMGNEQCQSDAAEALKNHIDNKQQISNFLRPQVQTQGVRKLDTEYCLKLWVKQQASTVTSERRDLINALGATENSDARQLLLSSVLVVNGESFQGVNIKYSSAERALVINAIANNNPDAVGEIVTFLIENYVRILALIDNNTDLPNVFSNIAGKIRNADHLEHVRL